MTQKFNLGDKVEITGPSRCGTETSSGRSFKIDQINIEGNDELYSTAGLAWYPASSLRLVEEELKVGDYVEIIKESSPRVGEIFRVSCIIHGYEYPIQLDEKLRSWWRRSSLRKLSPEEVKRHLAKSDIDNIHEKLNLLQDQIDKSTEETDKRLEAIEKKLSPVNVGQAAHQCDRELNQDDIRISITINDVCGYGKSFTCPKAALDWCKRTLEEIGGD